MPQLHLPLFPSGATEITAALSFCAQDSTVTYFHCGMPVFSHDKNDRASFRLITAQLHVTSGAAQAELAKAFGVSKISIKRAVKLYRSSGAAGFFAQRAVRGGHPFGHQGQHLDQSHPSRTAAHAAKKNDTDSIALTDAANATVITSKSVRSSQDSTAPMGRGASNVGARVASSLGALRAVEPVFQSSLDVPCAGVLFALPALLALGLLDTAQESLNTLPNGYYGLESILILLAFMALARVQTLEALRYQAPGEWGKLLGLDRIPEVRTLRAKIEILCANGKAQAWGADLSQGWMQQNPEQAGVLYVDGHTWVYHGAQTQLPRHYVARQKLRLRATVDIWVNAMDGQPFFAINKVVDPGLIQVIENDIVPRLMQEV